jgi:hypothetical protein
MGGLITGIAAVTISAGTTAMSFVEAGKERRKADQYEQDADKALAEARRALQVNYAKQMSVNNEVYGQERLAAQGGVQQFMDAAADADPRGAAAAAGAGLMSLQGQQRETTNRQTNELINIENAIIEEDSRLRDINVGLDMQEVEGAQLAASDSRNAAAAAKAQGIQGAANTLQQGLSMVPLYTQNRNATKGAIATAQELDPTFATGYDPVGGTNKDFRQFKKANPGFASDPRYMQALAGVKPAAPAAPAAGINPFANQGFGVGSYQGFGGAYMNNQASFNQQPFNLMINPMTGRPYGQ